MSHRDPYDFDPDDMLCAGCGDDPCCCQDCARCLNPHHSAEMHWVGDDKLCESCHDQWLDEQASWVGDPRINAFRRTA